MTLKPWHQVVYPSEDLRDNRPRTRRRSPSASTMWAVATCGATTWIRAAI
jgi:hypothetical protein